MAQIEIRDNEKVRELALSFDKTDRCGSDRRDLTIFELTDDQLNRVPLWCLIRIFGYAIDSIWNRLSAEKRANEELQLYKRCVEHFDKFNGGDVPDCPAPMRLDCRDCRNSIALQ